MGALTGIILIILGGLAIGAIAAYKENLEGGEREYDD